MDEAASIRGEVRVDRRLTADRRVVQFAVGQMHGRGWRLDKYLHAILPTLSRGLLRRWIEQGYCLIDGVPGEPRGKLKPGQIVLLDAPLPPPVTGDGQLTPLAILEQGPGFLVANKPAGQLPHQAGRHLTGTLLNQIQDWFAEQGSDPAEVRLVNRIDRDTSGIVLASLNLAAHTVLAQAMESHSLRKEYRAICHGRPEPAAGAWTEPIWEPSEESIAMRIHANGKPSHTDYEVLETAPSGATLLRVLLRTGRQHQIRIHAAHHGHPLIGDWVYGPACAELRGQALHAAILAFPDPVDGHVRTVEAPLPGVLGNLWEDLRAGGTVTPRELSEEERSRLGMSGETGQRLPSWLSAEQRAQIEQELAEDR